MELAHVFAALAALLSMSLSAASAHAHTLLAEDRLTPPALNVAALHERWERTVLPAGSACSWPTYLVDATQRSDTGRPDVRVFRSLQRALADAAAAADVCGPTIRLAPGRYEIGLLEIAKPTIVHGAPGAVLVGTLVNVSDAPIWLQDVSFESAPFPGALLIAHRDADVSLIRVHVRRALGFGIVQYGGRLEMWATDVVGTRPAPADAFGRLDALLPRQRAPTRGPVASRPFELVQRLTDSFSQRGRFGPGAHPLVAALERAKSEAWIPLPWSAFLGDQCAGSGQLVVGPAWVGLHGAMFAGNSAAGLVVRGFDALVGGETVNALGNGYGTSIGGPVQAIADRVCVGGINVRDSALMLVEGLGTFGNNEVGVLVDDAKVGIESGSLTLTQSTSGTWGDNVAAVYGSFLAISGSQSILAVRAGILYTESAGNLVNSSSSLNRWGLVIQSSSVYYDPANVDFSNNTELPILTDGNLPVPNEPLAVPEAP